MTLTSARYAADKVIAAVALVLTAPVFLVMSVVARRRPGSLLRSQLRIGVDGRIFRMLGFRATRRDSVLNAVPRLVNVLRGDMSLVGPRAPRPEELARQLRVRPGILTTR